MNTDTAAGQFKQLKGKIKAAWGNLTDDDIALYNGKSEEFYGKVQEHYGIARDEAEKKVKAMQSALKDADDAAA